MNNDNPAREERQIRIDSPDGAVEGCLHIPPRLRTLDDLNLVAKRFVTIHSPHCPRGSWELTGGPLAINKESILFVRELSAPPPKAGGPFGSFTRAPVRLRLHDFEIEGFVHVPPGGSPMKRLDQGTHPFVSLTTALICGPEEQASTQFLAVNRRHITTAQVVELGEESPTSLIAATESER